jgi:ribosome-binding protein aMBF1 (putative translation factor)
MMDAERQKRLEAIGWKVYDHAGDVFGMTEAEKQEIDFRIDLSNAVRKRRESLGLSPQDLATRLKISKRRVAKIEWGDGDISLDEMLRAYSALGGRLAIKELPPHSANGAKPRKKKPRATA